MSRRKWEITTYASGKKRVVELVVYDSLSILRREATKFSNRVFDQDSDFREAEGVCHGFERVTVRRGHPTVILPHAVIIRLAVGHVTPTIVSHEIAHAVQHLYKIDILDYSETERAVDHINSGNEDFAHLYSALFTAAWRALEQADLITAGEQQ